MGFLSGLFGGKAKNSSGKGSRRLDKNNLLDVCYAFGVLAAQVGPFERAYVQVKINPNDAMVQIMLDKSYCQGRGVHNLNNPKDLMKLGVPNDIANFVPSINARFKNESSYMLEVYVPHMNGMPGVREIKDNILRSQVTARLPVNYGVQIAANGVVLIQVDEC